MNAKTRIHHLAPRTPRPRTSLRHVLRAFVGRFQRPVRTAGETAFFLRACW